MEARQRREMKAAARAGQPWTPRWFKLETVERADGSRMGHWRYKVGAFPLNLLALLPLLIT